MNHIMAENFMRSAKAPAIRAGVMMAKVSWNIMKTVSGTVLARSCTPSRVSPDMKMRPRPPTIVLPGENFGPADGPWLGYMRVLEAFGRAFPGFEKELEGAELTEDGYRLWCLTD